MTTPSPTVADGRETFATGATVQCFKDFGRVVRPLASGFAYRVTFPNIGEVTCLASALRKAPENVTVFRKREIAPEQQEYAG